MSALSAALSACKTPTLLIGNGINRYGSSGASDWQELLENLAEKNGLQYMPEQNGAMSNTEFFDILDLEHQSQGQKNLQSEVCSLMKKWKPSEHHIKIVKWAQKKETPIITVNFDKNLSCAIKTQFFHSKKGFTDYYPWDSYFSDKKIDNVRNSFAIWHAHGMMCYSRSIRLGLTHYMGSVQKARRLIYNKKDSLRMIAKNCDTSWAGKNSWLDIFFFNPIVVIGFACKRDETFIRWLFLERARLYKIRPEWKVPAWYFDVPDDDNKNRGAFFDRLGIKYEKLSGYEKIYDDPVWFS